MKIKILANFHVFVPSEGREKKIAFTAGRVIGFGDMPDGHTMQDWKDNGLAVDANDVGSRNDEAEAGAAV